MRRRATLGFVLASLLSLAAPVQAEELRAEVIHWWTSGGESAAVKVFADKFHAAGGTWVDTAIAGGANARTAAINRTVGGNPPTAMQFNTGKQFDDLVENDLLANIDAQAAAQNWNSILPAAFVQAVTRNGHVYAVPVNIHGQNWLFYSIPALAKAGAQPPTNWEDLFPALDKLKAAGLVPLAFGGQKNWERNLFNNVLAGEGGRDLFVGFWGKRDVALVKGPAFHTVAETFKRLRGYVDQGSPGRNWNDATNLVIQGKAGMQFMGDWAKGEFTAAGLTPGKDYGCTVLGDHGIAYVMGGDVFAFPRLKDPAQIKAQQLLARVLLEPETQLAFAQKKGSIPVRLDLDTSSLDVCAQKASKWIADPNAQVPANELLSPPALTGAIEDIISLYWNDPSMTADTFIAKVANTLSQQF
ncbi:MAG TPA: ABC transporter substrate-binding protein [Acetobacteraceae bacterium]|nr:ABC transporter substrate-binding protein [Acetobacteraceae bacterium]